MTDTMIYFDAPAVLRKWPSIKNERVSPADGLAKPKSQHHLYEIHTAPQGEIINAVLSANQILEIARLRDFL
jgi:hypothetical protein